MNLETPEKRAIRILWYLMYSPDFVEKEEREWLRDWLNEGNLSINQTKRKKQCNEGLSRLAKTKFWQCNNCKKKFDNLYDAEKHFGIKKPLNSKPKRTR